ncbi:MAG TPA: Mut7-C RNAse domain-containing protein [Sumerlaeia bacterium]|nr:Mut7-C RNAse domain-containing protein [Sumerlaeia bacterium]
MRFVADNTVGKLRRWMSLLGYDVRYDPRSAREILRDPAPHPEEIVVLGRCPRLAAAFAGHGPPDTAPRADLFHVESPDLKAQIAQVTRAFPLDFSKTLFSRCSHCNAEVRGPLSLETVLADESVPAPVPEKVRDWRTQFYQCPSCRRVYWEGTHTERIRGFLREEVGLSGV